MTTATSVVDVTKGQSTKGRYQRFMSQLMEDLQRGHFCGVCVHRPVYHGGLHIAFLFGFYVSGVSGTTFALVPGDSLTVGFEVSRRLSGLAF